MHSNNLMEAIIGAVVLIVAGFFLFFAYSSSKFNVNKGYHLFAKFDRIDGLSIGSDVKLGGVKIGSVIKTDIDKPSYLAVVEFTIRSDIKLPKDSSAEIISESLLGDKFLSLVPGGEEELLKPNNYVIHTQSSVNLEAMIGEMMFQKEA